jgi:hypothetical protein
MRAQYNPEYYIFQMKHLLPKSIHAGTSSTMSKSEIGPKKCCATTPGQQPGARQHDKWRVLREFFSSILLQKNGGQDTGNLQKKNRDFAMIRWHVQL